MTNEEAKKIRSAYSNGFQYPFGGGFVEKCDMAEVERVADLLDKAIKRQIPQEPALVDSRKKRISLRYECPVCHGDFVGTAMASYCYRCGQALDWDKIFDKER